MYLSPHVWWHHDIMTLKQIILMNSSQYISSSNYFSFFPCTDWLIFPLFLNVKRGDINSFRDKNVRSHLCDCFEWTLDTIKDVLHDSWSQFHRQRLICPQHRITNSQTSFTNSKPNKIKIYKYLHSIKY